MPTYIDHLLGLAVEVAEAGGRRAREGRERALAGGLATKTSPTDVVSELDREVERLIVDALLSARPDDEILGEEGGGRAGTSGVRWIVDPIDGTVNYLYGIPQYAVSVAAERDGEVVAGVVHDPAKRETWAAVRGGGASRDGVPLRCTAATDLAEALIATGFSYAADVRARQAALLTRVLPAVRDVRRLGAAALDLCAVAAGQVDGYYEWGTHRWDVAAGGLIAQEAGARVGSLPDGTVVAATPGVYDALRALLTP